MHCFCSLFLHLFISFFPYHMHACPFVTLHLQLLIERENLVIHPNKIIVKRSHSNRSKHSIMLLRFGVRCNHCILCMGNISTFAMIKYLNFRMHCKSNAIHQPVILFSLDWNSKKTIFNRVKLGLWSDSHYQFEMDQPRARNCIYPHSHTHILHYVYKLSVCIFRFESLSEIVLSHFNAIDWMQTCVWIFGFDLSQCTYCTGWLNKFDLSIYCNLNWIIANMNSHIQIIHQLLLLLSIIFQSAM